MHGHVHNGVYCSYAETAINEFLREEGLTERFDPRADAHGVVYHVKRIELDYEGSAGFDDVLDLAAAVHRVGNSSLTFSVAVTRAEDGAPVARAEVVWVCVDPGKGRPRPLPEPTRKALAAVRGPERPAETEAPRRRNEER
ncbi:acyl-CoA thioesterase [Streptomyces tsukubensis]|nr:acyl-CoA thioesterase [Streptomyces tsukubensis]